jgi:hydrogenase-4 component F
MEALVVIAAVAPVAAAAVVGGVGWTDRTSWSLPGAAAVLVGCGAALGARTAGGHASVHVAGPLRVDALSAFMLVTIGTVALVATTYGVSHVRSELDAGSLTRGGARVHALLVGLFLAAMVGAVVVDNLGLLWVAVEATTIATAFLVGQRRTRSSLEASWKYVVVGSVGVALALFGTVLVYYASRNSGGGQATLAWADLAARGRLLDRGTMRLGVGLLVLGYGTKVGLAPLHTWLPDAHSQAPAPVSALMSGVLLSVAFYALLRVQAVAGAALGTGYVRGILGVLGVLSLLVSVSLMIAQRDLKRLLAYSSIEHMGIVALAAAVGSPLAIAAGLLHVLGHGLGKSVAFCAAGEILRSEGTTEIAAIRGLLARRPVPAAVLVTALAALAGLPPASLFASEVAIVRAGIAAGMGWVVAVALAILLVGYAAVAHHGSAMLLGSPDRLPLPDGSRPRSAAVVPLVLGLGALVALGVTIRPVEALLRAAAAAAG